MPHHPITTPTSAGSEPETSPKPAPGRGPLFNPALVVRRVARPVGAVVLGLACAMALCGVVGLVFHAIGYVRPAVDHGGARAMLISALVTAAGGLGLRWWGERIRQKFLTRRDAIVVTAMVWVAAGLFGSLPYLLGSGMSPVDAVFEAVSGFTTTGATVVTDIEGTLSRPVLLWRSLTEWLGGMGIIVLFVAVFPGLGAGGKHLMRAEVPGPTQDVLTPRVTETALVLWVIYLVITVGAGLALTAAGMAPFEAVCHALTTAATGGFSTRDTSIAAFDSPLIEMIITAFILLAGVNFGLYYRAFRTRHIGLLPRSIEFRAYVLIALFAAVTLTMMNFDLYGDLLESARYSLFTTATFLTGTGYTTANYMTFGHGGVALVVILMFTGGCAGSTTGGMKVSRIVVMLKTLFVEVKRQLRPNVVQVVRVGHRPQRHDTLLSVLSFVCVFFVMLGVGTVLTLIVEPDAVTTQAFGANLAALANVGPAPYHVGADNFASYGGLAKMLFAFEMVLGRLEFLTVLALGLPSVWRP